MKINPKGITAILVILLILVADQVIKIWVKTHMHLGESIDVTTWFKIFFVENNGMAFGFEIIDKLFLTVFRIIAVCFIGYYIFKILKETYSYGYIICISLIFAGALGNIIDCVFYGIFFSESTVFQTAQIVTVGNGYSTWLHGRVVDMFYCPIIDTTVAGQHFIFFSPVFNLADSAISIGIVLLLIFYRKTLSKSFHESKKKEIN